MRASLLLHGRRTRRLFLLLAAVLLITPAQLIGLARTVPAAPPETKTSRLTGLRKRVGVQRDERGVPYITAADEADLYFAQGYVTATDRLWQMDLLRRSALGEMSEVFGKATLEEDKNHRLYNFKALSESMLAHASPQTRAALDAYARGVNSFIESLDEKTLPPEFGILGYRPRPWRPSDSLLMGKLFAEMLSVSWPADLRRAAFAGLPPERQRVLWPDRSPLDVLVVGQDKPAKRAQGAASFAGPQGAAAMKAEMLAELDGVMETTERSLKRLGLYNDESAVSNSWVVAGKHTRTGRPMLANDPHLQATAPPIWHMVSLSAKGLRVAGVTVPGLPGVVIGHNERIAWGITNLYPDVQDLYAEKFDTSDPRRYMTPQGWREAEVRTEVIRVRADLTKPQTEPVSFQVTSTRHGPIVFERGGVRYALRWTALEPSSVEIDAFYAINRARNWSDFTRALSTYPGPPQNFVYADAGGHIGYYGAGRIPLRKSGDGSVPYDGATDAGEWGGYIPFKSLPHVYDPPAGVIVAANQRVVGDDYPHHLTYNWNPPYRARRIYELLRERMAKKLSVEDFREIQGDTYSYPDAIFTGEVLKLARSQAAASPAWAEIVKSFEGWDARASAQSRVMTLAVEFRRAFRRRVLQAAVGPELAGQYRWGNDSVFVDYIITERPPAWLPKEAGSYEALILSAYQDARAELKKKFGEDESQWTWGRTAPVNFAHPLAGVPSVGARFVVAPLPLGANGSSPTVNAGAAVSMRFISDLSSWDNTRMGLPLGESGDPSSPHWKDQLGDWQAVTPRVFPFSAGAIETASRAVHWLEPAAK